MKVLPFNWQYELQHVSNPIAKRFRAMLLVADHIGWPKHYKVDLSTDLSVMLGEFPFWPPASSERFIWVVREYGTHIFPVSYAPGKLGEKQLKRNVEPFKAIPQSFKEDGARFFYWDGNGMFECSYGETMEIISSEEYFSFS